MTKEQTKRDLYDNPEKTAFAMRPESEKIYNQVSKIDKQTTWEEEFDKRFNKDTLVSAHTDWTPKSIKDFISETISQEKEKCIKEEVFAFMHHLQEKANTVSPNLLLNEVVNYAYDRINLLKNK